MSEPAGLLAVKASEADHLIGACSHFRDPNGAGLPLWPVYDQYEQYLKLDLNISVGQRLKDRRVEFWTDTLPLIMSASEAMPSPSSSLILFSLPLSFLFSVAL